MSTNNICFRDEIRKKSYLDTLLTWSSVLCHIDDTVKNH